MSDDHVRAALERNRERLTHAADAVGFRAPPDLTLTWFRQLVAAVLKRQGHSEQGVATASRAILELPAAPNAAGIPTPLGLLSVVERELLRLRASKPV